MSAMTLKMVIQAIDQFTAPLRDMGKAVGEMGRKAEKSLGTAADEASHSKAQLASLTAPVAAFGQSLHALAKESGLMAVAKQTASVRTRLKSLVAPIGSLSKKLKKLSRDARFSKMAGDLGKLGEAMKSIGKNASLLGAALAGTFWGMDTIAKEASEHRALAQSVNMSAQSLSAWAGLVKEAGFQADNIVDLVEEMNNKIGESKGLGEITPVTESLQILNLQARELAKLAPEKQFEAIMTAAASMNDQQQAVSAVDILMGGEANKIMGHLRSQAKERNLTVAEMLYQQRKLNLLTEEGLRGNVAWTRASNALFSTLGSALNEVVGLIGKELAPLADYLATLFIENFGEIRAAVKNFAGTLPQRLKELGKSFKKFWESTSGVRSFFMSIADLVGPFNLLLGAAAAMIAGPLIASLVSMTAAFVTLGAAIGLTPLGWILGGIAALIAGGALLIANWDTVVGFFQSLWQGVKAAFSDGLLNGVIYALNLFNPVMIISKAVNALVNYLFGIDLFAIGQDWMAGLWEGLKAVWSNISAWLSEAVKGLVDFLPDWIKDKIGLGSGESSGAAQRQSALPENGKTQVGGTVRVAFENAPASMRVRDVKQDGHVGLNVDAGYNMVMP